MGATNLLWLSVLPVQYGHGELIAPPASDVNFVYALALFVFILYQGAGIYRRGPGGQDVPGTGCHL